ncbi:MAG: WYL domain-containing protein [Bacilli bacterium]|jgi:predicted DNA-binding transcriptional regulator YafY|nr:WYL domain-containing protein [Bacilli bacterium]
MSKISNVIMMLQYLSNGRKYSIKELSEKLEVTPRMIRVYKEELEKAGIYIDSIMGPYGGYVLNQEIKINKDKNTNIVLSPEDQNKYNILTRAIKEKRKVKLLYTSKSHGDNYRVIDPAEMYIYKDGWYCVAYCELREDMRQFGLKDIKEIELLDEYF